MQAVENLIQKCCLYFSIAALPFNASSLIVINFFKLFVYSIQLTIAKWVLHSPQWTRICTTVPSFPQCQHRSNSLETMTLKFRLVHPLNLPPSRPHGHIRQRRANCTPILVHTVHFSSKPTLNPWYVLRIFELWQCLKGPVTFMILLKCVQTMQKLILKVRNKYRNSIY